MGSINRFLRGALLALMPIIFASSVAAKAPDLVAATGETGAADGGTAISGRVLATDGSPLRDVLMRDGTVEALSDATGHFILQGVADTESVLVIDGRSARDKHGITDYGYYETRVHAEPHKTTMLPFTSYLPKIDHRHEVTIASPSTKPVVVTTPAIPGLELRIPAGAILTDPDGKVVTRVGLTPIPVDRTPFPLPKNVEVPIYFTAQPGGAIITMADGSWKGAQVVYPNYTHQLPRARATFWRYDPDNLGWVPYGAGTVTADGKQVVPDERTQIYALGGAMLGDYIVNVVFPAICRKLVICQAIKFGVAILNATQAGSGGDPVDLGTGLFIFNQTDLSLDDVMPLDVTRTYRPADYNVRPFGVGMTFNYDLHLWSANEYQEADLIMPDGSRIHYTRVANNPPSNGYIDATFVSSTPGTFYNSSFTWNGGGWSLVRQDGMLFVFGDNAPLQYIQDRFGNRTTVSRSSPTGPVSRIISQNGRFFAFTYDSTNTVITKITDNAGRSVSYTYDNNDRMTSVTDPDGGVTNYTWDTSNRIASMIDANKNVITSNIYDKNDRVTSQSLAGSGTFNYAYILNGSGNVVETDLTDPKGIIRKTTFDTSGYVLTDKFAVGTSVEQDWSYVRQPVTGLLRSWTDPINRTTSVTYDGNGNILSYVNLSGTPNAIARSFTYSQPFNQFATIVDPLGHTTALQSNALGEAISTTDPLGNVTAYSYDVEGHVILVTDPLSHKYIYNYDHGDLSSITDPLGHVTKFFIDTLGRTVSVSNALGQTSARAFDPIDGVSKLTDANGATTLLAYDPVGHLAKVTDARNSVTAYTYDARNRLASRTDPVLAVETATSYDTNDNLLSWKDRKGQVTTNTYDQLNRLSTRTYADGATVTYTWDLGNRLIKAQDSIGGTISWGYDGLDRLTSETTSSGTVSYTYDAAGRLATKTIPGQSVITYTFDNADRLQKIVQGSVITAFVFDNANRLQATNLPNSISEAYGIDSAGNYTSENVTRLGTTLGTLLYTYDAANRLSTRSGTLFQSVLPTALNSATYNASNRLTQRVTPTGTTSPTWDANGNLTNDGTRTYVWDSRDRLTSITGVAGFAYDALSRRSSTTIASNVHGFLYDGENAVQETSGGTVSANIMGADGYDNRFTRAVVGGATSTYITDILGSTVALADSTGTIQTRYGFDPYGNSSTTGAANDNSYQYIGRENDSTGLYYLRARYYNPVWGRFISEDPIGLRGGINRYGYANSNPVQLADPSGLDPSSGSGSDSPATPPQTKSPNGSPGNPATDPAPPELDGTGKVHGIIPPYVPDGWTDEQLEELERDLEQSIENRQQEQIDKGEDGPHRDRLAQERNLLRQIRNLLIGKGLL